MKDGSNGDGRRCGDCNVAPGQLHVPGCDVERCPFCGGQMIGCDCCYRYLYPETREEGTDALPEEVYKNGLPEDKEREWEEALRRKGLLPWTGEFPGVAECRAFGWYAYLDKDKGWVKCGPNDHPDASEDLNRLYRSGYWDSTNKRWLPERPQGVSHEHYAAVIAASPYGRSSASMPVAMRDWYLERMAQMRNQSTSPVVQARPFRNTRLDTEAEEGFGPIGILSRGDDSETIFTLLNRIEKDRERLFAHYFKTKARRSFEDQRGVFWSIIGSSVVCSENVEAIAWAWAERHGVQPSPDDMERVVAMENDLRKLVYCGEFGRTPEIVGLLVDSQMGVGQELLLFEIEREVKG